MQALAGYHRRWGVAPRPEDVCLALSLLYVPPHLCRMKKPVSSGQSHLDCFERARLKPCPFKAMTFCMDSNARTIHSAAEDPNAIALPVSFLALTSKRLPAPSTAISVRALSWEPGSQRSGELPNHRSRFRGFGGYRPILRLLSLMAARASRSPSRRFSVSRLSQSCLPLATASSHLTRPLRK